MSSRKSKYVRLTICWLLFYSLFRQFAYVNTIFRYTFNITYTCLAYLLLGYSIIENMHRWNFKINSGLFLNVILIIFTGISMISSNDHSVMFFYSFVMLIPLAINEDIINDSILFRIFLIYGIILAFGVYLNVAFTDLYMSVIYPSFQGTVQNILASFARSRLFFPGFMSQVGYTSFFLCIAIGFVNYNPNINNKIVKYTIIAVLMSALVFTGKRGAILFCALSITIVWYIEAKGVKQLWRIIAIALIFIVGYHVMGMVVKSGLNLPGIYRVYALIEQVLGGDRLETSGRINLYSSAWELFIKHPFTGIGWDNYRLMMGTYAHFVFLQLLCESGIFVALLYYIFMMIHCIKSIVVMRRIKLQNDSKYHFLKVTVYIQIFFLLYCITGNPLYDIEMAIIYYIAIGVASRIIFSKVNVVRVGEP